ncbi:hypothetical protein JXB41_00895 [Candidatus Woesearchaeota archaeon]|nr:hypothetical protein [Candidatus Woesearchaeota archaeon]
MKESLEKAREELKRIDHLVYVTLKYTRTVDVLFSIIQRMVSSYEFAVDSLLKHAVKKNLIESVPEIPLLKAQKAKEVFNQKIIHKNIDRYLLFRKLLRTDFKRQNEYRRHVTMSTVVDEQNIEINIDNITEMYHSIKKFIDFIHILINEND